MENKDIKIIITFNTTADAFAIKKFAKKSHIEGRLITVPRELSAGCGTAWMSPIDQKQALIDIIKQNNLYYEQLHEMSLNW